MMVIGGSPITQENRMATKSSLSCHHHQHIFLHSPFIWLLYLLLVEQVCAAQSGRVDFNGVRFPTVHEHHQQEEYHLRKIQAFKAYLLQNEDSPLPHSSSPPLVSPSPSPVQQQQQQQKVSRVFYVTSYGADPTGNTDSTDAFLKAFADATNSNQDSSNVKFLMSGITDTGGVQIFLEGGRYLVNRPLRFPVSGVGNMLIHGGTLEASDDFPKDGYLIDLSSPSTQNQNLSDTKTTSSSYNYEFITFKDIMLDCNFRGGGISIINSLRTTIDNSYISHFTTNGIFVKSGHETMIHNSFLGQHITAGNDPHEKDFTGTAINLKGNDNVISNVIIFSAATGIIVSGQANLLSGVHCYNKATGFGGTGIYLNIQGSSQTRIVNSYMDYTGIVVEDPVQVIMSNNFFLGDGFITLKSVRGVVKGVNIVDNMFSGSGKGIDIVRLEGEFGDVKEVVVDRNNVEGMNRKSTVGKVAVDGNGTSWVADFNGLLLFPNRIRHVQYSCVVGDGGKFVNFALRNFTDNKVLIESDVAVNSTVYVTVNQGY